MSGRIRFVELLEGIAESHNLTLNRYCSDWIIRFENSSHRCFQIYGYSFDANGSGCYQICGDKNATSDILRSYCVPCVPHEGFLNPADDLVFSYVPGSGTMSNILKFAEQYSYKVVVKPLKGTGGICVFKTCSPKEVEAAVYKVWSRDYGVAVSPLLDIVAEIRVIVYNGQHRLVYRKNRIILTGDGQRTVKELLVEAIKTSSDDLVKHYAQALAKLTPNDLADIPQENQQVPIEWRHNLGLGASPEIIDHQAAAAIAVLAANVLGMKFCSVDVIQLADDSLQVLEVNAGVMMDSFLSSSDEYRNIARKIYTDVILDGLNS